MSSSSAQAHDPSVRQRRMKILADAPSTSVEARWSSLEIDPSCEIVRGPETGLVMLQGRIGGGGAPFNLGEATATRATVRLESGVIGHACHLGRDTRKVTLAAIIDALTEEGTLTSRIDADLITPLEAETQMNDQRKASEVAATTVDFFTLVRGEDA